MENMRGVNMWEQVKQGNTLQHFILKANGEKQSYHMFLHLLIMTRCWHVCRLPYWTFASSVHGMDFFMRTNWSDRGPLVEGIEEEITVVSSKPNTQCKETQASTKPCCSRGFLTHVQKYKFCTQRLWVDGMRQRKCTWYKGYDGTDL